MKATTVHGLIEQQATSKPQQVAVRLGASTLTYNELETRARQFVTLLTTRYNVKPGQYALVSAEKSLELIVALYAFQKLGVIYTPWNFSKPTHQLTAVLSELNPSFVCALKTSKTHVVSSNVAFVPMDKLLTLEEWLPSESVTPLYENSIVHILSTSGTSGKLPKRVVISHKNLVSTFRSWEKVYDLHDKASRHLCLARPTFDVFYGDFIRALGSGGELILCPDSILLQPDKLYDYLVEFKADFAEFVPATLKPLMTYLAKNNLKLPLNFLVCGSDTWTVGDCKDFQQHCAPQTQIINSFGTAETTIDSTYFLANAASLSIYSNSMLMPIGVPFAHANLFLMDPDTQQKITTPGQVGELCISGPGVSQGYFNRPELNKTAFPVDAKGQRFYRTGDLVRLLKTGQFELIGRTDRQIKLEGERVELNLLETLLTEHPKVKECIVLAKKTLQGSPRLTAYIVSERKTPSFESLQRHMQTHAPAKQSPKDYHLVKTLPLSAHGKINRRVVDTLAMQKIVPKATTPRTRLERTLHNLWQDVLNQFHISTTATFISYGGSSYQWVEFIGKAADFLGLDLVLKDYPMTLTLQELSKQLSSLIAVQRTLPHSSPKPSRHRLVIVGGGPASISCIAQLLSQLPHTEQGLSITVIEKGKSIGPGLPFSTTLKDHILNLGADIMSPVPGNPKAFVTWLQQYPEKWQSRYPTVNADTCHFPPRSLYGLYLQEFAADLQQQARKKNVAIRYITEQTVTDVQSKASNQLEVTTDTNQLYRADQVVLALGHLSPDNYTHLKGTSGFITDIWPSTRLNNQISEAKSPVVILGTRLSAIDAALALISEGHQGTIHMVSRSGLLPTVLGQLQPYQRSILTLEKIRELTLSGIKKLPLPDLLELFWQELELANGHALDRNAFLHPQCSAETWLEQEINAAKTQTPRPWQCALLSMYSLVPEIWQALSTDDQATFLSTYYSVFMAYLAAFPVENAEKMLNHVRSGQIQVHGSLQSVKASDQGGFEVTTEKMQLTSPYLINATGPGYQLSKTSSPLLHKLAKQGLVTPHRFGGIDVSFGSLQVKNQQGNNHSNLFAVGEITRGVHLATTDLGQIAKYLSRVVYTLVENIIRPAQQALFIAQHQHTEGFLSNLSSSPPQLNTLEEMKEINHFLSPTAIHTSETSTLSAK